MTSLIDSRPPEVARLNKHTYDNLVAAMKLEGFAFAKYMLFAKQAREHGRYDLAALFEDIAIEEHLRRFQAVADLAGMLGTDLNNLDHAVEEETEWASNLYQRFAGEAAMTADKSAQELFLDLSEGQTLHQESFLSALRAENFEL